MPRKSSKRLPPRKIDTVAWAGYQHSIMNEAQKIPKDSPRRKPTLPKLKFMEGPGPREET